MTLVELISRPGAQYHFGNILPTDEDPNMTVVSPFPQSDLLFSALVNIWAKVFGDANALVDRFMNDEIQISSAFFYLKTGGKTTRFLPKPIAANLVRSDDHKKLKKIQFVSENLIMNGILPNQWFDMGECKFVGHQFLCLASEITNEISSIYDETVLPKVKVHTDDKEKQLYSQTNIQFCLHEDIETGYYFYLSERLPDDEREKLHTVIRILADEGLGGDRTSGCGLFEGTRIQKCDFPQHREPYFLSISLGNPSPKERDAFLYYQVVTRGGRKIASRTQLKYVNMIAEGAIVKRDGDQPLSGRIVDVSPNNDGTYLRNGKVFLYPLHPNYRALWEKDTHTD